MTLALVVYGVGVCLTAVAYGLLACVGMAMSHEGSWWLIPVGLALALVWPVAVPVLWWRSV